jgi:hypothetical protein
MSVGSTTSFEESRDDIIAEALENVGAIGPGATRDSNNSELFDSAARALNRVVKSVDKDGQRLWRIVRRTTTTTDGIASFSLASDVLDVDAPMRFTRAGQTAPASYLDPMSRDEYMLIGDRTQEGTPRQFFVERTLTAKTVYLWPVPDATGDTIEYAVATRAADFTTGANTPDFPAEWTNCLVYGLTMELAPKFDQMEKVAVFKTLFESELVRLIGNDTERGNVVMYYGSYGGGAG